MIGQLSTDRASDEAAQESVQNECQLLKSLILLIDIIE